MRATSSAGMTYRIVGGLVPNGFCGISNQVIKIGAKVSLDCANRAQSEGVLQTTTEVHKTSVVTTDVLMGLMCFLMCVELTRGYKSPIFVLHCVEALNPFAELLWQCYKLQTHKLLWCCNNVQHLLCDTLQEVCT